MKSMKTHSPIGLAVLAVCTLMMATDGLADWPQWRGPTRDGVVAQTQWPNSLDEKTLRPLWKAELSEGYPGPIVSGDRVFTVGTRDKQDEVVRAFDRKTGKPLWERSWPGAMKVPAFARRNGSWIKSTPACDGERLYVIGMLDELVCLDVTDGKILWNVDFKKRYGTNGPSFGQSCSPLLDGDALYIQAGLSVCKIDKKTGKTLWRVLVDEREMMGGAFSSPTIETVNGKRQLLVQTRMELCGVDLETGEVLWRKAIKAFRGMNILTPTVFNGQDIFTASYGGGSFMLRVSKDGDGYAVSEKWQSKVEGYMSSPLLIDGHIYMHRRDKKVSCIAADTGEVKWTSERKFGEYWSSIRSGNKILALDEGGTLLLLNASPDKPLDVLSERKISEQETWGHLAIDGDLLFIRELNGLSVYQWSQPDGVN